MTDDSPHSVGIKPKSCVFGGDSMCTYKYVYVLYTHTCVFLCVFAPRSFCLIMSAPHRCTTPPRWKVPALHAFTFFLFDNAFYSVPNLSKPQTRPKSCDQKHYVCESLFKKKYIHQQIIIDTKLNDNDHVAAEDRSKGRNFLLVFMWMLLWHAPPAETLLQTECNRFYFCFVLWRLTRFNLTQTMMSLFWKMHLREI